MSNEQKRFIQTIIQDTTRPLQMSDFELLLPSETLNEINIEKAYIVISKLNSAENIRDILDGENSLTLDDFRYANMLPEVQNSFALQSDNHIRSFNPIVRFFKKKQYTNANLCIDILERLQIEIALVLGNFYGDLNDFMSNHPHYATSDMFNEYITMNGNYYTLQRFVRNHYIEHDKCPQYLNVNVNKKILF